MGGIAAISLADTVVGPAVLAFLAAAVIYNAGQLTGTIPASLQNTPPHVPAATGGHAAAY